MANRNIEYLQIKAFLYKITPNFTKVTTNRRTLSSVDRYTVDIAANADANNEQTSVFSKYDISDFVATYSVTQDLDDNTYNWNLELRDDIITFKQLNERHRVEGPRIEVLHAPGTQLAQYEDQSPTAGVSPTQAINTQIISAAKVLRGRGQRVTTTKVGDRLLQDAQGLRLSDLVQSYDMISVFLYKNNVPLGEYKVEFVINPETGLAMARPVRVGGTELNEDFLQEENVLLSPGFDGSESLFSPEISGYVTNKSLVRHVDAVDRLTLSGTGVTRLFGATRKLLKSSIRQDDFAEINSLDDPAALTTYENTYVDLDLEEIFADLFDIVYKIRAKTDKNTFDAEGNQANLRDSFYDIASLQVANFVSRNLFTLPPFLLAFVMKRRGFKSRQILDDATVFSLVDEVRNLAGGVGGLLGTVSSGSDASPDSIGAVVDANESDTSRGDGRKRPIYFSTDLDALRAYFALFTEILKDFAPETKTPYEIIEEIKDKTFIEFFERPDGTIFVRPPQFNNKTHVVLSGDLDVIESSYTETVDDLISRQVIGYAHDVINQISHERLYAYNNGKLFKQFGFMEAAVDANPNFQDFASRDNDFQEKKDRALFRYAEYFLRLHNASLKTGSITCNFDSSIQVGRTFFDEENNKFGYITGVSKEVSVSGNAMITFTLSYVRDAQVRNSLGKIDRSSKEALLDSLESISFETLDRLIDIANAFSDNPIDELAPAEPFDMRRFII